jgi:isopropylmalate/homocitrate/citramalate synthase
MANTMAGIEAGASLVDVTVNGIGERAGNAPLDEVAAALTHVFGYDLGIKLGMMKEISERVAQLSKIPLSPMKPLVGESAFTNTLGAHQWGARQGWFVYEPILAEVVGNQRKFPLGRLTHHLLVRDKLAEQGYSNFSEYSIRKIAEKVRSLAEKEGRFVTEKELKEIGQKEIKKLKC